MPNLFVLVLTFCGTLDSHYTCERYTIDTQLTQVDCLTSVYDVFNRNPSPYYDIMSHLGYDWDMIASTKLECKIEVLQDDY